MQNLKKMQGTKVLKIMNRTYDRLKVKVSDDDRFNELCKYHY